MFGWPEGNTFNSTSLDTQRMLCVLALPLYGYFIYRLPLHLPSKAAAAPSLWAISNSRGPKSHFSKNSLTLHSDSILGRPIFHNPADFQTEKYFSSWKVLQSFREIVCNPHGRQYKHYSTPSWVDNSSKNPLLPLKSLFILYRLEVIEFQYKSQPLSSRFSTSACTAGLLCQLLSSILSSKKNA